MTFHVSSPRATEKGAANAVRERPSSQADELSSPRQQKKKESFSNKETSESRLVNSQDFLPPSPSFLEQEEYKRENPFPTQED